MKDKLFSNRKVYITAIIVAVALIAIGIFGVWRAFARFDKSIMTEKDAQISSLMRSDDINIENSIKAFEREADTFLGRQMLREALRVWDEEDDASELGLSTPPLVVEPVFQIVAADGTAYLVSDQDVVGILRDKSRPRPTIALKPTPDLKFCSQRHGQFLRCDDGSFAYQNLSSNGTVLTRGETSLTLGPDDDPVVLAHGDKLVLGSGNAALTFEVNEG